MAGVFACHFMRLRLFSGDDLKSLCQLVRAGRGFEAAFDSFKARDCLIYVHAFYKASHPLGISAASADKFSVFNHIIFYVYAD